MAKTNQRSRRTRHLFAAAVGTTAAAVVLTAVHLAFADPIVAALLGLARPAAAVLWICWFSSRIIDRRSIAYSIGYVEGVARRHPNSDTDDLRRITYLGR